MSLVVSAPLSNQIQGPFIDTRRVYEIRERPSRMYSWTALITAQILSELPLNIFGSSLFFLIWYWLVGFPSSRAGYSYLMFGIMYPMYYTTFAQWVAAMSPNPEIAAQLFSFFFSFVVTLSVVFYSKPGLALTLMIATAYCSHIGTSAGGSGCIARHLTLTSSKGCWVKVHRSRLVDSRSLLTALSALGHSEITCAPVEYVTVRPPLAQTCQQYLSEFISTTGGYVTNPSATDNCQFCSYRTTDEFLESNSNIFWSHHWRNFGFMWIYVGFNVRPNSHRHTRIANSCPTRRYLPSML